MNSLALSQAPAPSNYRFDHPRLTDILHDMYVGAGEAGPGDAVGPFRLDTVDGRTVSSEDAARDGRPLLLIFGSRTCPVTESAADGLKALHDKFGAAVRFVMVQVREAHPGALIPQPRSAAEKMRHALDLRRHHRLPFEVAVDDLEGTLHQRLGARPSSAFLLDAQSRIQLRVQWANQVEALDLALEAVTTGQPLPLTTVTRTPQAVLRTVGFMSRAIRAAGHGASRDTWRVAPPMALMMTLADFFTFLPPARRGLPVVALMTSAAALAVVAVASFIS